MGEIVEKTLTDKNARNEKALKEIALESEVPLLAWGLA